MKSSRVDSMDRNSSEESEFRGAVFVFGRSDLSEEELCSRQNSNSTDDDCEFSSSLDDRHQSNNPFSFAASAIQKKPNLSTTSQKKPNQNSLVRQESNPMATLVTECSAKVNRSVDMMRRLQSMDDQKKAREIQNDEVGREIQNEKTAEEELVSSVLADLEAAKAEILRNVPQRFWERIIPENVSPLFDFPLLFGRCFNLSLNLKILSSSQGMDPTIASRIVSDICVLEVSLQQMLVNNPTADSSAKSESAVNSLFTGLRLENDESRPRFGFL